MTNPQHKPTGTENEMKQSNHPAAKKVDADPNEENNREAADDISIQSQKGKKVDADPSKQEDQPTEEE